MTTVGTMRRGQPDSDLQRDPVEAKEDGQRIGTDPGCFEWWYFDATLSNGVSIVVVFSTKPFAHPEYPLTPEVRITIKWPGTADSLETVKTFHADEFAADSTRCSVSIGKKNRIEDIDGDLRKYGVEARVDNVSVRMLLTSASPACRIGNGHLLFDQAGVKNVFGWLAPVPHGTVEVIYSVDGREVSESGFGYHDHDWGDAPAIFLTRDWYWGHARVGNYTVVASHVTAQDTYGGGTLTDLVLIQNDNFIACGGRGVTFSREQPVNDALVGTPYAGFMRYEFLDKDTKYAAIFRRTETIYTNSFSPTAAYRRLLGPCTLEISNREPTRMSSLSEFMWLGSLPPVTVQALRKQFAEAKKQPPAPPRKGA